MVIRSHCWRKPSRKTWLLHAQIGQAPHQAFRAKVLVRRRALGVGKSVSVCLGRFFPKAHGVFGFLQRRS